MVIKYYPGDYIPEGLSSFLILSDRGLEGGVRFTDETIFPALDDGQYYIEGTPVELT